MDTNSRSSILDDPDLLASQSLIHKAAAALARNDLLVARKIYTEVLSHTPYNILAYVDRSQVHLKLGYPDLAAGDAYRALLLGDAIRETVQDRSIISRKENGEYDDEEDDSEWGIGEQAFVTTYSHIRLLSERVLPEDQIKKLLKTSVDGMEATALFTLARALKEARCFMDALTYCKMGLERYPDAAALPAPINFQAETDEIHQTMEQKKTEDPRFKLNPDILFRHGGCRREVYPWNHHEPDRVVDLPILQKRQDPLNKLELSDKVSGSEKQLGVYAKEDIYIGETFFREMSPLTVLSDPEYSRLCEFCAADLGDTYETCEDCWEGDEESGIMWCSEKCKENAMEKYHPALCGRDFGWVYRSINASISTSSAHSLLLLKTYATAITLDTHPLELPEVKYLYGVNRVGTFPDYKPTALEQQALPFNFTNQVTRPIQMLMEMDVDIFQPNAVDFFDLWVIQTLWAKFIGVASARVHKRTGRTEIAAVHMLYSMFNHSCEPNISWECGGEVNFTGFSRALGREAELNTQVVAVKKGEECFSHYCDISLDYRERQEHAWGPLGGRCSCTRCTREEEEEAKGLAKISELSIAGK
ncbi:uncharacterized protein H6S33_000114 [Morchella sextelata]|uniref:uncharacterized protein n=1 Tax=Morchella sextelata TaxID=1174677 RepID=UPI001D049C22|nr:uncharacterized protein H6S33_000114 [Morchella sextelata]KAH0614478.1 hypothetical protein H6S33_000114 [Morchella sextelata]